MSTDSLGNAVTLESAASLAAAERFRRGLHRQRGAGRQHPAARSDDSPIVQAYCAALHMFAETRDAPAQCAALPRARRRPAPRTSHAARTALHRGRGGLGRRATSRARSPCTRSRRASIPRDLASLKLGHYHLFNRGDSPGMLRMALAALPAAGDVPYLHGMLAFAWEQCHFLEQAEAAARQAIAMRRKEPWAHHALAHVMLTQGRIDEGHAFLQDVSPTWTGLNSFMVTHNWWHQALFALELERHDEVLALYDQQVWGVVKEYTPGPDQRGLAAGAAGTGRRGRGRPLAGPGQLPGRAACTTRCCRSWTCSTSTAWRAPAGRRPTRLMRNIERMPSRLHRPDRGCLAARLPAGQPRPAGACAGRLASAPSTSWARPCPAWWKSAAAMRSATCSRRIAMRDAPHSARKRPAQRLQCSAACIAGCPAWPATPTCGMAQLRRRWLALARPVQRCPHAPRQHPATWRAALLAEHAGELVLCGASMGGMVAMEAARQAPEPDRGAGAAGHHRPAGDRRHAVRCAKRPSSCSRRAGRAR